MSHVVPMSMRCAPKPFGAPVPSAMDSRAVSHCTAAGSHAVTLLLYRVRKLFSSLLEGDVYLQITTQRIVLTASHGLHSRQGTDALAVLEYREQRTAFLVAIGMTMTVIVTLSSCTYRERSPSYSHRTEASTLSARRRPYTHPLSISAHIITGKEVNTVKDCTVPYCTVRTAKESDKVEVKIFLSEGTQLVCCSLSSLASPSPSLPKRRPLSNSVRCWLRAATKLVVRASWLAGLRLRGVQKRKWSRG